MSKGARDDFRRADIEVLAKRAGGRCSNPTCRRPTSGPDPKGGSFNLGVAAHIAAASFRGPRFDDKQSSDQRSSIENGIWLCQSCSRLVDADHLRYSPDLLLKWKEIAEAAALLEISGYSISRKRDFSDLERKVPDLVDEMRRDLARDPYVREFVVLQKGWVFNYGATPLFTYFIDDHQSIFGKLKIFENFGAVIRVHGKNVDRFEFSEDFVDYLLPD